MRDDVVIRYRDDTVTLTRGVRATRYVDDVSRPAPLPAEPLLQECEHGEVPQDAVVHAATGDVLHLRRIKLRRIVELVERDDPLSTLCPAEQMLIKGVGDLLKYTKTQLDSQYLVVGCHAINVYCERDWRHLYYRNIVIPEPVILEVRHVEAKLLSFGIPCGSTETRPRTRGTACGSKMTPLTSPVSPPFSPAAPSTPISSISDTPFVEPDTAALTGSTAAVGLRHYDPQSDSFMRIPHGGEVPAEAQAPCCSPLSSRGDVMSDASSNGSAHRDAGHASLVRICIELSPYTNSFGNTSFGNLKDVLEPSDPDAFASRAEGRVGYDTSLPPVAVTPVASPLEYFDPSALKAHREADNLVHLYDESELNAAGGGKGSAKKVVRKGVPLARKGHFYNQLLCNPVRSRRFPEYYGFDAIFEMTFRMPYAEMQQRFPSFTPLSPMFGADGLSEKYHQLKKNEVRSVRIVLAMVARKHPLISYFPVLPMVLCCLVKYLTVRDLHAAAVTLVTQTVPQSEAELKTPLDASGSFSSSSAMSSSGAEQMKYRACSSHAELVALVNALAKSKLSGIYSRFAHTGIALGDFGGFWITTLFTTLLPRYLCERIVDMYILEGVKVLYRMALAVLKEMQGVPGRSMPYDAGLRDDDRLVSTAFNFPLKKKELMTKRSDSIHGSIDTSLQNVVMYRPKLAAKSRILDDPQYLETIYSWIVTSQLQGELRLVYDKNEHGKSLQTLAKQCSPKEGAGHACLVVVKAVPRQSSTRSTRAVHAEEEVFGYYLSDPLVPRAAPFGKLTSFGFKLVPQPLRVPVSEGIRHCIFPSTGSLSLGVDAGTAFLNFDDTGSGTSSALPIPQQGCQRGCAKGACSCARPTKIPPVCGGKFLVLDFEVFQFVT
eukprot:TRINITY_DN20426_c0_g1_i1.p1 TRINITY_DN20426_c0_g1~~TRINITY_DN20426_c0_g1_i1.p1  ORF type:complete len:886 (+),score=320.89 TRINITY_DN20426_c0_g1_i1:33-2690(+)